MFRAAVLNDTRYENHHGCEQVMHALIENLNKRNIDVSAINPVRQDWNKQPFIRYLEKADIVVVNGEGTIHHDQPSAKNLVCVARFCKERKIPVVLINSIFEMNSDDIVKEVRYFDRIYVRESKSQKELSLYGIQSIVVPDLSYYIKINERQVPRSGIGVTDCVLIDISRQLFKFAVEENDFDYLPALKSPRIIKLFPIRHTLSCFKYNIKKNYNKCKNIVGQQLDYRDRQALYYYEKTKDYINKINSCELIITGRFHSLCFAIKTKTPFIAISPNTHKTVGMLNDIGLGTERMLSIDQINSGQYKMFIGFSEDEENKIDQYLRNAENQIDNMFDDISGLIIRN